MKYLIICFWVFAGLFALAFGADCNVKGHAFNKGDKYQPPGECTQVTCDGPGKLSAAGCPAEHSLKPCKFIPMDTSKPYPQCCGKFEC